MMWKRKRGQEVEEEERSYRTLLSLIGSNNSPHVGQGCKPFFFRIKSSKQLPQTIKKKREERLVRQKRKKKEGRRTGVKTID